MSQFFSDKSQILILRADLYKKESMKKKVYLKWMDYERLERLIRLEYKNF